MPNSRLRVFKSLKSQGLWLGVFVFMGSLARVIGPLAVAEIYELWGTYVLFITVTATLVLSFVITLVFWRQLVAPIDAVAKNQAGTQPSNQLKEEDEANISNACK